MMEIRELNENDLESLLELYTQLDANNETCSVTEAREIWKRISNIGNIKYIGAVEDNTVISTCYIVVIPNLTSGGRSIGFIENVVTDINHRKKGIGKKVIEEAIRIAKERGCYKVILQSGIKREGAHLFYKKLGFDDTSKKAFDMRIEYK